MLVKCKNCLKEFNKTPKNVNRSTNHFCTRSCSSSFRIKHGHFPNPPKERKCKICTKVIYWTNNKRRKFCEECKTSNRVRATTLAEYQSKNSIKGKHPSWKNAHIRGLNRSWNADLAKRPCQVCGYSKHTELAHIKAISSFPPHATIAEINNPLNILVLCPNHHWEFDSGIIPLIKIPPR